MSFKSYFVATMKYAEIGIGTDVDVVAVSVPTYTKVSKNIANHLAMFLKRWIIDTIE